MAKCRVLFADDQIPSPDERENEAVKRQILKIKGDQLRAKWPNPADAVAEDREWFEQLLGELRYDFQVTGVRRHREALDKLRIPADFDVAIVDLSWTGDPDCKDPENAGFALLDVVQPAGKPVIALSQKFRHDRALVGRVMAKGALPIQKDYSRADDGSYPGHQALEAAVGYLARGVSGPRQSSGKHLHAKMTVGSFLKSLSFPQLWALGGALVAVVVTAFSAGVWFNKLTTAPTAPPPAPLLEPRKLVPGLVSHTAIFADTTKTIPLDSEGTYRAELDASRHPFASACWELSEIVSVRPSQGVDVALVTNTPGKYEFKFEDLSASPDGSTVLTMDLPNGPTNARFDQLKPRTRESLRRICIAINKDMAGPPRASLQVRTVVVR